ncbi:hypothetical protein A5710_20760 [Mycolicibacter sinensis]|uniref:Uncharacterized protein n=1 Tax=Mycolicibacter sinensis (strain JDM601) TaxID=875328 RepID=A0A1A2XXF6_MYCSD|nr:hypothetical protein A5710_20760 [Mycolicibacter sinensis]
MPQHNFAGQQMTPISTERTPTMLTLSELPNPDGLTRFNVREHYAQRLVLIAAVCRELQHEPEIRVGDRALAAIELLAWWMRWVYDLPEDQALRYSYGFNEPYLTKYADDMFRELAHGAAVCDSVVKSFTADKPWELDEDMRRVRMHLDAYLAAYGQ